MSKCGDYLKNLRVEYKVVLFFVMLLIFYTGYNFLLKDVLKDFFSGGATSVGSDVKTKGASSINEAVSADRPIIIAPKEMQKRLDTMSSENREVKGMELATEVDNPTVWIYVRNDGERKDDLAARSCQWLHDNGILASSVTILDEAARNKGKLIEIGESKCM